MGKRSDGTFERLDQDRYLTPQEALAFLKPHLPERFTFCEPCAANGNLTRHLEKIGGRAVAQYDISPEHPDVKRGDARHILSIHLNGAELVITNPPWDRAILHPMILRFSRLGVPCWCLFDADWAFTDQGAQFMDWSHGRNRIHKIVVIGRLKWISGSEDTGKDNAAWFLVGAPISAPPAFFPRLDVG